jgi:hypothetical protein
MARVVSNVVSFLSFSLLSSLSDNDNLIDSREEGLGFELSLMYMILCELQAPFSV